MTYRTFIASILVAAITVTGWTAAPARAGSDDAAKIIAGVAALAIIGAAIADNKRKDRRRAISRNRSFNDDFNIQRGHKHERRHGRYKRRHQDNRIIGSQRPLPQHCQRGGYTNGGYIQGFGRQCLLRNYSHYNALPHECAVRVYDDRNRERVIYRNRCLNRYGFRDIARR